MKFDYLVHNIIVLQFVRRGHLRLDFGTNKKKKGKENISRTKTLCVCLNKNKTKI